MRSCSASPTDAARAAGDELLRRFGRPEDVKTKDGLTDLVSAADRAAELAIDEVVAGRRLDDGVLGEEGTADRDGSSGLRWVVDPLDGTVNYLLGLPLWCVSIACEDAAGTVAGVILDPVRDELFAAARGRPATLNGAAIAGPRRDALAASTITGTVAADTEPEARRHGKLDKRLYRRVGQRRSLGTAALELAWTAAGRIDLCYQEQRIHPWDVDAGLFICQRAGLRVHRLPPLEDGLAPRFLAAPAELASEVLELVGPGAKARRRAAAVPPLSTESVAEAMRRRAALSAGPTPRAGVSALRTGRRARRRSRRRRRPGGSRRGPWSGPSAPIRTPARDSASHSAAASATSKTTMFVSTRRGVDRDARPCPPAPRPAAAPARGRRPAGRRCARARTARPAATIPAWRSAPPSICL